MTVDHRFGGPWTDEKLKRLTKYLAAYTKLFKSNPQAAYFHTIYLDAFAGSGYRTISKKNGGDIGHLFDDVADDQDASQFKKGSVQVALDIDPPFDEYVFVDQNPEFVEVVEQLCQSIPERQDRVSVVNEEANSFVARWCSETDWKRSRAVAFLDPYGMQVDWSTIVAIARTKAIDLWLLFPLGQSVNRLLTRRGPPSAPWSERLTRFFGDEKWKDAFYAPSKQTALFGEAEDLIKEADFDTIGKFFVNRLKKVFACVAPKPLALFNSKNVPIFLLCFAAGNPRGAPTAVKIADHILQR